MTKVKIFKVSLESTTPVGIKLVCWVREKRLEDLKAIAISTKAFSVKTLNSYIREDYYLYRDGHKRQTNTKTILTYLAKINPKGNYYKELGTLAIPKVPYLQLEIPNLFKFE